MAEDKKSGGLKSVMEELPLDRLREELSEAAKALGEKGLATVTEKITGATDSLNDIADGGGVMGQAAKEGTKSASDGDNPVGGALKGGLSGVKDKVKGALPGGGGGNSGSKATKSTNIIEEIDVGVPIDVAYNQWTQFQDFSGFMKKVDSVDQEADEKVTFKAQVFWSHRTWEATILEQVPNERIVWKSKGEKGHVDGAVTFHELGPNLTRILVVLEYYPQGLFERTGNIWRAQGRRARLELKHFRRHVMTRAILEDELEGWRGEIRDGEVVRDHDEVVEEEQQEREDQERDEEGYDEDETEDEYDDAEDEYDEPDDEDEEPEDGEVEDEEEEPEDEYEEPEDEYEEPEDEGVDEEEPQEEYDEPEDEAEGEAEEDEVEDGELEEEPEEEYAEDEYEEPEEEPEEEEPEEKPRQRSSSKRTSTRKRR